MTDRQIAAVFFPDTIPKPKKSSISLRESFWKINENRGLSEAEIQRAWAEYNKP